MSSARYFKSISKTSNIRKLFAFLLSFSMLVSLCVFASAEDTASDISISYNAEEIKLGKEFNVTVSLTNNQEENVYGGEFEFYYDSSILEFSSYSANIEDECVWETEILNSENGFLYITSFAGFYNVDDISSCGIKTGSSIEIVLTFKAVSCGDAVVSVKNAILLQGDLFQDFDLSDVNESIKVAYPARVSGASLLLDSGIRIVFYAVIPDEYAGAEMKFIKESTNNGVVSMRTPEYVSGTNTGETGTYGGKTYPKYEYIIGTNPDKMGEKIHACLVYNGVVISSTQKYSVIDYCNKAFSRDRSYYSNYTDEQYSAFITLLSDMLTYGAASQEYTGHNKENLVTSLVTEGYELSSTKFVPIESTDREIISGDVKTPTISSAAIALDSTFYFSYKIKANSIDNVRFEVTVDTGTSTNSFNLYSDSLIKSEEGIYYLHIRPAVKGVDYIYTLTVYDGEGNKGRTVKYSIKSYVYTYQNSETLGPIVQRLYNYGTSLRNFANLF